MNRNIMHMIKQDRQTVLCLLVLLVAIIVLFVGGNKDNEEKLRSTDSLNRKTASGHTKVYDGQYATAQKNVKLFAFDPNTADSTQLLALGLQPWQVKSIYNYRAAGGVYSCPEDFAQLYGLTVKKYRELLPYIRIADEYRMARDVYERKRSSYGSSGRQTGENGTHDYRRSDSLVNTKITDKGVGGQQELNYLKKLKDGETIDLNTADTIMLRRVPGIGPYFARKIVRYRERIGGFMTKEQLLEIQDFPESALPFFVISKEGRASIRKININSASSEALRSHPYISFIMARQIMDYRRLKGKITDLNDLRMLSTFSDDVITKLRPYIVYE